MAGARLEAKGLAAERRDWEGAGEGLRHWGAAGALRESGLTCRGFQNKGNLIPEAPVWVPWMEPLHKAHANVCPRGHWMEETTSARRDWTAPTEGESQGPAASSRPGAEPKATGYKTCGHFRRRPTLGKVLAVATSQPDPSQPDPSQPPPQAGGADSPTGASRREGGAARPAPLPCGPFSSNTG